MNLLPDKKLFIEVPFQSTKYRKKELCVDNKLQETIGDVYCPTCRKKDFFIFQPIKRLVSTTVKSAKPAATFSIFHSRTKNRQLCGLAARAHIALSERRVVNTKMKNHLPFGKSFSANHNEAHLKLSQKRQKAFHLWHSRVDTPLVDTYNPKFIYNLILNTFSLQ